MNKFNIFLLVMWVAASVGARDFYVDAVRGDDANDATTAQTAWRSIARAQKQKLAAGDRILLRAGCMWRLDAPFALRARGTASAPVVVTRYGDGAAPELRTSLDGLALDWREEKSGLWSAACGGPDVGNIVWGGDCAFKKARLSDVKDDGDFFHDKASGRLLLKWPKDPRTAFMQMEICRRVDVVHVSGCRHAVVDGIAFMYTGAHGMRGCNIDGLAVRNCMFGWIGGSFLAEPGSRANRPDGVRYGNGIEIWAKDVCRDIRVEGCFFHDVYDTAMTNQGDGVGELDGMSIVSNRTLRCEQSYEYWFTNPGYKVGTIDIFANEFLDAGYGWSHAQRPNKNATHILSYSVICPKGRVKVRGNRFGRTKQCAVWLFGKGAYDWVELGENEFPDEGNSRMRWQENGKSRDKLLQPAAEVRFLFADTNRAAIVRTVPLRLRRGFNSLEIAPNEIPDGTRYVEVTHPWARASAGERGWWVLSDGMYGEFEQGKDAKYTEWRGRVMQVWGFSSPRGAIAAIHKGLRYEAHYHVERKGGEYRLYDRYDLGDLVGGKVYSPITIDYHVLPEGATYVDVARAYKAHQLAALPGLKPLSERIRKSAALAYAVRAPELRIRQAWKPVPSPVGEQTATNEPPMTVAITFDRVRDIVLEMKRQGIGEATITLVGWNIGGHDGRFPQLFPVEPRLGGEDKLRELIVCARTNGYWIACHNNYSDAYSVSALGGRWMPERYVAVKGDGTYKTGGTWGGGKQYFTCLGEMLLLFADEDYSRLKSLGFAGLHYTDCLSLNEPLTCHASGHPASKEDYAASALALMRKGCEYFGGQASEGGFDHVIEGLDYCMYLSFDNPGDKFKSPLVKKHVPLWNLVYNGYVLNNPYCASTNYTRKKPINRVKLYETAGRPLFYFHSKFTSNGFNWMGSEDLTCETDEALRESVAAIRRGYDEFAKCRDLQLEEMSAHRELAPGVTESTFSDGTRILANSTDAAFTNEAGTVVASMDYAVARPDVVLIEAEDFAKRGGWRLDTQFVHKMGSAYLLAASAGTPVKDAVTSFEAPHGGRWTCWARTKDWIPEHSPGRFAVAVDGSESAVLGASGKPGWMWERAGEFELTPGRHELRLVDKTGYFARCDAVLFAADPGYVPPERSGETFGAECEDGGEYDVVVVGAGTAGMAASVAAARAGARTALVQDRPVLGGNASSEFGVGIHGASYVHPNSREGGLIEEARLIRLSLGPKASMSDAYRVQAAGETNLAVRLNERVLNVEKDGRRISAVLSKNTLTGRWTRYRAKAFVDCTGDGWLGYYAGVPYRKGREGRDEFGEAEAPDEPDALTMSGVLMADGTWCFQRRDAGHEVKYETPVWARILPEGFTRKLKPVARGAGGFGPVWWIEHSGDIDDFEDPEGARDMLVRISFAYFGWGKNEWEHRDVMKNEELVWVPYKDGRRETLRLVGDYVMTGNDQKSARVFPDRISYGGWPMDTHDPLGMMNPKGDGFWKNHPNLPVYTIPYRVLYSPALDNFFFAGRCQSVTHMALGSVRLMSTVATLGQACGTAAAECVRLGLTPKGYGESHIAELQQRLLKDDQYIPGLRNEDPADLARTATVTASSSQDRVYFRESPSVNRNKTGYQNMKDPSRSGWRYAEGAAPRCVVDGVSRIVGDEAHAWVSDAAQPLPQWVRLDLPGARMVREVRIVFNSDMMPTAPEAPMPPSLAKAYCVEVLSGGEWRPVAEVAGNARRLCVHEFAPIEAEAVRVTVKETYGAPEASVFEVRVY